VRIAGLFGATVPAPIRVVMARMQRNLVLIGFYVVSFGFGAFLYGEYYCLWGFLLMTPGRLTF
jgi:hypothetical protein